MRNSTWCRGWVCSCRPTRRRMLSASSRLNCCRPPTVRRSVSSCSASGLSRARPESSPSRIVPSSSSRYQVATVTGPAVQPVVDAFGDGEEVGIPVHHQPSTVDAGTTHIGDERPEQLSHATSLRGRVDVEDDSTGHRITNLAFEPLHALYSLRSDEGRESSEIGGMDIYLPQFPVSWHRSLSRRVNVAPRSGSVDARPTRRAV